MAKPRSQSLVIDASVARAAGGVDAVHPTSKECRKFLLAVRDSDHRAVFSNALWEEWRDHRSQFSQEFHVSLFARKRLDRLRDLEEDETLRSDLSRAARDSADKERMLKDAHLIEAARATGHRIASLDEKARRSFRAAAGAVACLRPVCWVHPTVEAERPIDWLNAGAPLEPNRLLGAGLGAT